MSPVRGEDDHVATCEDGNRYQVLVNADARVIVEKLVILADKPGSPS